MQKKLFIIGGSVLILVTIGLFLYVFFVQKAQEQLPETSSESTFTIPERPARDSTQTSTTTFERTATTSTNGGVGNILDTETATSSEFIPKTTFTQISAGPIAGMAFVGTTTVRAIYQGNGTIADYNLRTTASKDTPTNLTGVVSAVFNNDASRVIVRVNDSMNLRFFAGIIAKNARDDFELRGSFLPINTKDAVFIDTINLRYLIATEAGGEVHTYEPSTRKDSLESKIPFTQAYFVTSRTGDTYIVTNPSASLPGAIYRYTKNGLTAITTNGNGLTAFAAGNDVYVTLYRNEVLTTVVISGAIEKKFKNLLKTDACVAGIKTIYCARPYLLPTESYPDAWYQGEERHNDLIFTLNTTNNAAFVDVNPKKETGQSFDILTMVAHPTQDNLLLFINKNNDSLWLYSR